MELKQLVTYRFAANVGPGDRIFRVLSGLGLATLGWLVGASTWLAIAMTVAGLAWVATGVVSRCGIYYVLGRSTLADPRTPGPS